MTTDELTTDRPTSSTDWAEAFHNYQRAVAAERRVEGELDAASAAWREAVPDRVDEFAAYGLLRWSDKSDRTKLIRSTEAHVAMVDYKGRSPLSADDFAVIAHKAATIVDDFLAWAECDCEATDRIYGDVQERFDAACDLRCAAQEKLLTTPAPDVEALLFKLDVLARIEREHDTDDADSVATICDDAHRLIGSA